MHKLKPFVTAIVTMQESSTFGRSTVSLEHKSRRDN